MVGGFGGFAGLFDASALHGYDRPLLATSTDGVGTKVAIATALDVHDTIGIDLVAMVIDDIVVCGAQPLFMTDYIACGRVQPERIAAIVTGIAHGCASAGCALVGGETAEHPGLLGPDEYDVAGAGTGVVEAADVLGPERVAAGDVVIAMASSGLHSNGYSLARKVLLADAGWSLDRDVPELGRTLGSELLEPTRIYAQDALALADHLGPAMHAFRISPGAGCRQHRPGPPGRSDRGAGSEHLGPAADHDAHRRTGQHRAGGPGTHLQHGHRHGGRGGGRCRNYGAGAAGRTGCGRLAGRRGAPP